MEITVTGSSGFIGTCLIKLLRERFQDSVITAVDPVEPQIPIEGVQYGQELTEGDVIFHLAGSQGIVSSIVDPKIDLELNAGLTIEVMERAKEDAFGRVVLASSCSVYGAVEGPAREDQHLFPVSPYGVSKIAAEEYVLAYHRQHGVDGRIARIGNAYGPGQKKLVIYDLIKRALEEGAPLHLHGDGSEVRDFVYVEDIARALIMIGFEAEAGGIYNIGSGQPVPLREVASLIATTVGLNANAIQTDNVEEVGKIKVFYPSVERIMALGFKPHWSIGEGISQTVQWVKQQI